MESNLNPVLQWVEECFGVSHSGGIEFFTHSRFGSESHLATFVLTDDIWSPCLADEWMNVLDSCCQWYSERFVHNRYDIESCIAISESRTQFSFHVLQRNGWRSQRSVFGWSGKLSGRPSVPITVLAATRAPPVVLRYKRSSRFHNSSLLRDNQRREQRGTRQHSHL